MTDVLVGLDLGTTSFKASVVGLDGQERAWGTTATPWTGQTSRARMWPDDVRNAMVNTLTHAVNQTPEARILGVGLAGMAETGFPVDTTDRELAPAIAWYDDNGTREAGDLAGWMGEAAFSARTGLPLTNRCSAVKARWSRQWRANGHGVRWENLPEWAARQLGGGPAPEQSLSARTGLLDLRSLEWIEPILEWAALTPETMQPAVPAGTPAGTSHGPLAQTVPGLTGAMVTVAGHDHLCASLGAGVVSADDTFDSWGTGEAVIRAVPAPPPEGEVLRAVRSGLTVGVHTLPGLWLIMAGVRSGHVLGQVLDALHVTSEQRSALDSEALTEPGGTPLDTQALRGEDGALHIPPEFRPAAMWRAALDATGHNVAEALEALTSFTGPARRIVAAGGWLRSAEIAAIRRSTIGPFWISNVHEATARGAALLAGAAAGAFSDIQAMPLPDVVGN